MAKKDKLKNKSVAKVVTKSSKPAVSFTQSWLDKYEKLGIWITLGLISVLLIIVFGDFISGNLFYLFKDIGSDSINISYPNYVCVTKYLHSDGFPLWSFAEGMGQNSMSFSVGDPFNWLVYLAGINNTAYAIIWIELLKIFLSAFFIYKFFELLNTTFIVKIIGTLLYCFSGFIIVGSGWGMFSTEAFFLAFLLFSFEMLYVKNSWYLFPLAIALLAAFQPFDVYLYGLFLVFYFLFRHFSSDDFSWNKLFKVTLKLALLTILGLVISTFFSYSIIRSELDSPRVGGNSSYINKLISNPVFFIETPIHYCSAFLRFFANDILGNGSNFKGWYNYLESPLFYIGILPLILFTQVFSTTNVRKRITYIVFFSIFILPVIFPFFRYTFWAYVGNYYRGFSFFVALVILILSLNALKEIDKSRKINLSILFGTFIFLLVILYYPYQNIEQNVNSGVQNAVRNFLVLYTLLLLLYRFPKYRSLAQILLVISVFIEISYFNLNTVKERSVISKEEMNQKVGYNDYSVDAVKYIKSFDKGFFRINKEYSSGPSIFSSINDAKVQDYYSTPCYNNFNQKYYIMFLEEMGIVKKGVEYETRWASGLTTRPLLLNLASNKYHLSKKPNSFFLKIGYDSIARFNDVRVYKNKHFLPLGFTYDKFVPLNKFMKASMIRKDIMLQKAFTAEESSSVSFANLSLLDLKDTVKTYTNLDFFNDVINRKQDTLTINYFSQNRIKGSIELKNTKMLFFSIPFDKGWNGIIDGKKVKPIICNIGFMGFLLQPGKHNVELYFMPPYFNLTLYITIISFFVYIALVLLDFFYFSKKSKTSIEG